MERVAVRMKGFRETWYLYAYAGITDKKPADEMADTPINRKRRHYMKDIMETSEDESPWSVPLLEVFHLERDSFAQAGRQ